MNNTTYKLFKITEKIFIILKKAKAFKTAYGLKNFNMSMFVTTPEVGDKETILLSTNDLYLGYDYLKDVFTLIDVPIKESPHYHLVECLYSGDDVSQCTYIQRWLKGTLDWRFGFKEPENYSFFINKFEKAKENIKSKEIKPVIVYRLGAKYYIYDGKHRAAMCAYNNVLAPCVVVDEKEMFSGVWKKMFDIIKDDKDYAMHKAMYQQFETREVR